MSTWAIFLSVECVLKSKLSSQNFKELQKMKILNFLCNDPIKIIGNFVGCSILSVDWTLTLITELSLGTYFEQRLQYRHTDQSRTDYQQLRSNIRHQIR